MIVTTTRRRRHRRHAFHVPVCFIAKRGVRDARGKHTAMPHEESEPRPPQHARVSRYTIIFQQRGVKRRAPDGVKSALIDNIDRVYSRCAEFLLPC